MMQTIDRNYTQPPKGDFAMSKVRLTLNILAVVIFTMTVSSLANAQATRTWVSGVGDDANPCSRTAPCKTFAGAISKTAAGGEISVLDPGGFGTVTINKSLTINGTQGSGYGSISSALTNQAILVNLSTAVVKLRNLDINGAGTGVNGIRILAAASVTIENVVIDGLTNRGVSDERSNAGKLTIVDSYIRNTTQSNIAVGPSGGVAVNVLIDNVRATSSSGNAGYSQSGNVKASIRNSVFSHSSSGILADSGELNINNSEMSFNTNGLFVFGTGLARLNNSIIEGNTTSINAGGQPLTQSTGTNTISGNTNNNLPTGTPISQN
jgi:hypothetical protein